MAIKKQTKSTAKKVGLVAAGLGAIAAVVGSYFMYGSKNAAKNRKAVKSWVFKAKAEVLEALENTQEITKQEYDKLIDQVSSAYENVKEVTKTEMADFKREMKAHWEDIAKTAEKTTKVAKKTAKKTVKKAEKKVKSVAKKASQKKTAVKKSVKAIKEA